MEKAEDWEPDERQPEAEFSEELAKRLIFLDIDPEANTSMPWQTATEMAHALDAHHKAVRKIIRGLGIRGEVRQPQRGPAVEMFPPYVLPVVREEIGWIRAYDRQRLYLHTADIAEDIGRSRDYTKKLMAELGIEVSHIKRWGQRRIPMYHKSALIALREFNLDFPFDDGRYNLAQLVILSGEDREWIERRLLEAGIQPEIRRHGMTGKALTFFPPESLELIRSVAHGKPPAAGQWSTAEAIAKSIGRSANWTNKRLRAYADQAQSRLDEHRVPRRHYSPLVVAALIREIENLERTLPAGDYLSTSDMAKLLGQSWLWVENRIDQFADQAELRKDRKDRINRRYPPEVLSVLHQQLETLMSYPESGDYLTLSAFAEQIGRTTNWVRRKIGRLAIQTHTRRDRMDRLRPHYHPDLVPLIKALYIDDEE